MSIFDFLGFFPRLPGDSRLGSGVSRRRLARIDEKVELLLRDVGLEPEEATQLPTVVQEAWSQGARMRAIRLYRDVTGAGLREAREQLEGRPTEAAYVARIEHRVDALLKHSGIGHVPFPSLVDEILACYHESGKMRAIKLFRELTGARLLESKESVEELVEHAARQAEAPDV